MKNKQQNFPIAMMDVRPSGFFFFKLFVDRAVEMGVGSGEPVQSTGVQRWKGPT